jgi:hypothetical protein
MFKKYLFTAILIFISIYFQDLLGDGMGNPGGMGMGSGPPCGLGNLPPCPVPVPLDGGVLLLAGAGIALGARKMMKKK